MPNLYLRQCNITFSRRFIDCLVDNGFIVTRRDRFNRSGIVINHGNGNDIYIGRRVNRLYLINNPSSIYLCANKLNNYRLLSEFYPKTWADVESIYKLPVMAKPLNGHHGYGIEKLGTPRQVYSHHSFHPSGYLYQEYIPIRHEYRFNIFDRDIYQISRRVKLDSRTDGGGMMFDYISLGNSAELSDKFYRYVDRVIDVFHSKVGNDISHYTIDVMKGMDNEYYLTEMNTACGLGSFTVQKLKDIIMSKYHNGELEKYRVR